MPKEFEYRYFFTKSFTKHMIKNKLKKLHCTKQNAFLHKITVYKSNHNLQLYIRTRDEGYKKTFTIKHKNGSEFDEEYETIISDIKMLDTMLLLLGLSIKYTVEKIREIWIYNNIEIVFDTYPGIPTYMEIEAKTEKDLNDFCKLLNLSKDLRTKEDDIYAYYYDLDRNRDVGILTFSNSDIIYNSISSVSKKRTFMKILKKQQFKIRKIQKT